jgi:hypothetical protein
MVGRRRWLNALIGATAFIGAALAAMRPDPYAFLDRFHPVDLMRNGPPVHLPGGNPTVTVKFLEFKECDASAVRTALLRAFPPVSAPALHVCENSSYMSWDGKGGDHLWFSHDGTITDSGWQFEVDRDETWLDRQMAALRDITIRGSDR